MSLLNIEVLGEVDIDTIKSELIKEQTLTDFDEGAEGSGIDVNTAKCGEILVSKKGDFTMFCIFCDEKFSSFSTFASHIYEIHLETDNDNEEILSINSDEIPKYEHLEDDYPLQRNIKGGNAESAKTTHNSFPQISISPISPSLHDNLRNLEDNVDDDTLPEIDFVDISVMDSEKSYMCNICGHKLMSPSGLFKHKLGHELSTISDNVDASSHQCKFCGRSFVERNKRIAHERIHTGEKPFSCEQCGKSFRTGRQVKCHSIIHSEERKYKCEFCDSAFKSSSNRSIHMRIHLNDRRYECDFCGKRFIRNVDRRIHMRSHTGEKPYQCEICGRNYRTAGRLNEHKKRHSEIKPFACEKCGKAFYTKLLLRTHAISHSDLRPFSCDICGATFPRRKALRTHQKIHLPVKQYVCPICGKAFAQNPGLYCHMKTHGVLSSTKTKAEESSVFENP